MSTSSDGRLTKYSTTRSFPVDVGRENISLAAYLPQQEVDTFIPARIKFASITSFKSRVLSDAEDVARGLGVDIHSLLGLTLADSAGSLNKESFFGRTG